jgi:hypothetical protein
MPRRIDKIRESSSDELLLQERELTEQIFRLRFQLSTGQAEAFADDAKDGIGVRFGNAAGRPKDVVSQAFTLELALRVLEAAPAARTTVQSPLQWSSNSEWKLDYCNVERLTPEEIEGRRSDFDEAKEQARRVRERTGLARPTIEDGIS